MEARNMEIRIDSTSEIPIRRQLAEQVIFLITTERFKPGDYLPSVRELARRLKIHHNTVSEAYRDLVKRNWLERRRGSRLTVRTQSAPGRSAATLDDLINMTIRVARENGYSMQALRERVRERLLVQPPDHILVVEQNEGLRQLIEDELRTVQKWPVEGCSREQLAMSRDLTVAALVVTTRHALDDVGALISKERPAVAVSYSSADEHLQTIRNLKKPSVIAVVSGSRLFLDVARAVLAPAVGRRHQLREILLPEEDVRPARAADVVFCDSIARKHVRLPKAIHYRLLHPESISYIATAMTSYRK
jgi:DNA-binding transcriptional regulator YhcF (GntR family)